MVGQPCGQIYLFFQSWAPPLPQLDVASVRVLHLDRWLVSVFDFSFSFFTRILRLYSILVFPEKRKVLFLGPHGRPRAVLL